MRIYNENHLHWVAPPVWLSLAGGGLTLLAILLGILIPHGLNFITFGALPLRSFVPLMAFSFILAILGVQAIAAGIIWWLAAPDASKICWKVKKSLYSPAYGNPLGLKNGTWCPRVTVTEIGWNLYEIFVEAGSCTTEKIRNCSTFISSSLNKQYARYAVIQVETDIAYQGVKFIIDDVAANHTLKVHTPFELWTGIPTKLLIQDNLSVDLTSSGSILVAGKTRSGKTTGIISLLLQVLQMGPDHYDSLVSIIDPKCAELSVLPHVVSPDEDGGGRKILEAMRDFAATMTRRQYVLNELSKKYGDAVHWWEAEMHPSFLFLDEFVVCRSLFPKKAEKDSDYCLATFDSLLKRIVTMGASAGCYVIISIAEASVEEGGLPSMIRSACTTKILFKPTIEEARLLWSTEQLDGLEERRFKAGDAWFTSSDGEHDGQPYNVRFPRMKFRVYRELGRLLGLYFK